MLYGYSESHGLKEVVEENYCTTQWFCMALLSFRRVLTHKHLLNTWQSPLNKLLFCILGKNGESSDENKIGI